MDKLWLIVGFLGQVIFGGRFVIQWISSERARKSYVPIAFWYMSIAGAACLLVYALHKKDPVFILGQSTGFLIYSRNLYLIRRQKQDIHGPAVRQA